jgi:hypothetical protein
MSIPHQLTREEVKRRMQEQVREAQQQYGHLLGKVEERWDGYTLNMTVAAPGGTVTGQAIVELQEVHVSIALPWMLTLLAGKVSQTIEQRGRQLLQPPTK